MGIDGAAGMAAPSRTAKPELEDYFDFTVTFNFWVASGPFSG